MRRTLTISTIAVVLPLTPLLLKPEGEEDAGEGQPDDEDEDGFGFHDAYLGPFEGGVKRRAIKKQMMDETEKSASVRNENSRNSTAPRKPSDNPFSMST